MEVFLLSLHSRLMDDGEFRRQGMAGRGCEQDAILTHIPGLDADKPLVLLPAQVLEGAALS